MGHEADRGTFPARSSPSVMGGFGGRGYRRCCPILERMNRAEGHGDRSARLHDGLVGSTDRGAVQLVASRPNALAAHLDLEPACQADRRNCGRRFKAHIAFQCAGDIRRLNDDQRIPCCIVWRAIILHRRKLPHSAALSRTLLDTSDNTDFRKQSLN
jgi:hypothetical protein